MATRRRSAGLAETRREELTGSPPPSVRCASALPESTRARCMARGPRARRGQQSARRNFLRGVGSAGASTCVSVPSSPVQAPASPFRPRLCKHWRVRHRFSRPFGHTERYGVRQGPTTGLSTSSAGFARGWSRCPQGVHVGATPIDRQVGSVISRGQRLGVLQARPGHRPAPARRRVTGRRPPPGGATAAPQPGPPSRSRGGPRGHRRPPRPGSWLLRPSRRARRAPVPPRRR